MLFQPNCESASSRDGNDVIIIAIRTIEPDTELCYDYCLDIPKRVVPCKCKEITCRKYINNPKVLRPMVLEEYIKKLEEGDTPYSGETDEINTTLSESESD